MPHIIHIDEAKLNQEFENTLDEMYLMYHNHPTNIPNQTVHDPGMGNLVGIPEGRTSSSVRQDGGQVQSLGGGQVNGCAVLAGFIGAALVFVFLCSMLSRFGGP